MEQYTPGEWEVSRDAVPEGHAQFTIYADNNANHGRGERVATAFVSRANADVIAAAPDLLAACKATAAANSSIEACDMPPWLDDVEAAIAKAEGNT